MNVKEVIVISTITFFTVVVFSLLTASPFNLNDDKATLHYAEGYYQSYTTPLRINITAANTYYNLTGFAPTITNGFYFANNGVYAVRNGYYRLIGSMSFSGGNSGEYEIELFVNNVAQPHCTFFRSTTSASLGGGALTCIEYLNAGDFLQIRIKDITIPAQSINLYAFNFNIVEIA